MIIYRPTDRVKIQIGELVFTLAPLTYYQKRALNDIVQNKTSEEGIIFTVRCSLKDIDGLYGVDGKKIELEFENDIIKEDCILGIIGSIPHTDVLQLACVNIVTKILNEENTPGIKIVKEEIKKKKSRE